MATKTPSGGRFLVKVLVPLIAALAAPGARGEVPCLIDVLTGTDPFGFTQPGAAVDIDGDWIIAGASSEGTSAAGAVYLFVKDGLEWTIDAKFVESPPGLWAQLGWAVAIDGDRAIAGAPTPGLSEFQFGRAHIYHRVVGIWQHETELAPSLPELRDNFGISVDIEGEVAVVGAIYFLDPPDPGKAFVFRWNGTSWVEEAILVAPGAVEFDNFGYAVAINGDRIAVGAPFEDLGEGTKGSVYVFKHNGSTWVQEARIRPLDDDTNKGFGLSVALRGDELVVGAPGDQTFSNSNGAVYVLEWSGTSWEQTTKLFPSNPVGTIELGLFVDIGADTIVGTSGNPHDAFAQVYAREGSNWIPRFRLEVTGAGTSLSDDASLLILGNRVHGLGAFPPCVPVTSSWGVLVMALGFATVGSIRIRRRVKHSCVCVCVWLYLDSLDGMVPHSLRSPV